MRALKAALIERYGIRRDEAWKRAAALWQLQQQPHQSTDDFLTHVNQEAQRLAVPPDQTFQVALNGLRPTIRQHVLQHDLRNVADIQKWARITESSQEDQKDTERTLRVLTAVTEELKKTPGKQPSCSVRLQATFPVANASSCLVLRSSHSTARPTTTRRRRLWTAFATSFILRLSAAAAAVPRSRQNSDSATTSAAYRRLPSHHLFLHLPAAAVSTPHGRRLAIASFLLTCVLWQLWGCVGERCFTIPDSNETKTFSNAKEWCKVKNSSLAIVIDETTQATLTELLNSMQLNEQQKQSMFIDLKLVVKERTWYLVNGTKYLGGISDQSEPDYRHYGYIKTYSDAIFYAACSQPNILRNFICEVEVGLSGCFNNSTNYHLYRGRCYAKYENGSLTWYQAREICHSNDGDLAMFNYDTDRTGNNQAPFDTAWLNPTLSYWIGVRWRDCRWSSSGGGDESTYTSWSIDKPNTINSECVCVDPNGKPSWRWTDCNCNVQRQFVCLKIVPTTIATTATTAPPKTPLRTTSLSFANGTNSNALAIGLGAGIGGGVFLILLVVIVVVAVTLTRKRRRKNKGVESQHNVETTPSTTTPNIELKTPDRSDVYAHVVPSTQHPTNNKSQNDVIYAQPDFSNNPISTLSDSDSSNVRQGKAKSILLEAPNDVYANAASVS